jgi:hypothetical protein
VEAVKVEAVKVEAVKVEAVKVEAVTRSGTLIRGLVQITLRRMMQDNVSVMQVIN